ncbi:hypothetical protein [Streptomyces albicerus]|uniref:hypothetical protein n=1 Tax=Streptomyces albicerus TaxID=2569859 RepID=UPI00124B5C27|nr:hypothetical protein [Streptomyces albicerus]
MADPLRHPATGDNTGVGPDRGSPLSTPPRAPRWVKASAITVGVLILLVVIMKLTGLGGNHGPGRHMGAGDPTSVGVTEIQAAPGGDSGDRTLLEGSY